MLELIKVIQENRIQLFAVLGSIFLLLLIIRLIQRRRLREEYAILWLLIFASFILISFYLPILVFIANVAGILYPPAALLLLLILGMMMVLIHYSTVLTKLSDQNKTLVQEIAMLKAHQPSNHPAESKHEAPPPSQP